MDKTRLTLVLMEPTPKTPGEALRRRQGAKIRTHRKLHKMSQTDLAALMIPPVTKAAVSEWERGTSTPRQHHQVNIAKALKTPWSTLFGLDGEAAA